MKLIMERLSKSYGSVKALRDVSLTLEPGIHALLGPNGSGKSTLMNILTDNLKADSGRILYTDGQSEPENVLSMGVRFREKLGFMPQYPGLYPGFTVYNLLLYMATLKSMGAHLRGAEKKAYLHSEITQALEAVQLIDCARRRISTLSGGMKQRLSLAQALLGNPHIIILDEPTAGLDPMQRMAVRNLIARVALNRIVLIATHVVSDVESVAKDILLLKKGELIRKASPHILTREMEGRVWEISVPEGDLPAMQTGHHVVSITRDEHAANRVLLRVLSEKRPTADARPLPPTLEDSYLQVFGCM